MYAYYIVWNTYFSFVFLRRTIKNIVIIVSDISILAYRTLSFSSGNIKPSPLFFWKWMIWSAEFAKCMYISVIWCVWCVWCVELLILIFDMGPSDLYFLMSSIFLLNLLITNMRIIFKFKVFLEKPIYYAFMSVLYSRVPNLVVVVNQSKFETGR